MLCYTYLINHSQWKDSFYDMRPLYDIFGSFNFQTTKKIYNILCSLKILKSNPKSNFCLIFIPFHCLQTKRIIRTKLSKLQLNRQEQCFEKMFKIILHDKKYEFRTIFNFENFTWGLYNRNLSPTEPFISSSRWKLFENLPGTLCWQIFF